MRHEYKNELIDILSQQGRKGLAVAVIARLIFNNRNELFAPEQHFERLHIQLQRYLWTQSKRRNSMFTHVKHGVYALRHPRARQLILEL